jgi:transposase, IS30 family
MGTRYGQLTLKSEPRSCYQTSQQCSARHIARTLHRSASTITRELKRFACWQIRPSVVYETGCAYDSGSAGLRARVQRFKPRSCSKLAVDTICAALSGQALVAFADRRHRPPPIHADNVSVTLLVS